VAQGWTINAATDQITFFVPPPTGTNNIAVQEFTVPATGGSTDVFALSAWGTRFGYPAEVEFFGGRLVFAATRDQPQTTWFSKIGNYVDFGKTVPSVDDDAIAATLNARQVNRVTDIVPLANMVLMTTGGEWKTTGGQDDVLTPTTIGFKPQSYHGSADLPALVIGNTALFVQNRGYIVRDIGYQFESDGYSGNDLTVFSSHLTEGKPIVDWEYQQVPYSMVWSVRSDGVLLALTYMKDQSVVGWTPMEIDGFVESVTAIPEGGEDSVYVVVRRTIGGVQKRYVERLSSRLITDVREGRFLDSHLTYDGRNKTATTITATGATWTVGQAITLTASAATFAAGDINDVIVLGYMAGSNARLRIAEFTSSTVVTAQIVTPIPTTLRGVGVIDWGFARDTLSGLSHLNGRKVGVLCDGFVQDDKTVASGSITLDEPGVLVHAGLRYVCDIETLEINVPGGQTTRLQNKLIKRLGVIVQDTRSLFAGPDFDRLEEWEPRVAGPTVDPAEIQNGCLQVWISGSWAERGRVCIRQKDPLPMAVLGVIPDVAMGDL
jgi:hypothetical protein